MSAHLSTGWRGDWRTLSDADALARAEMLERYYDALPDGVTSEAWAEARNIRRELASRPQDERASGDTDVG